MSDEYLSVDELRKRLVDAALQVKIGGRYVHYKGADKTYHVKDLILIEATNEVGVIYEADYDPGLRFMRPLSDWLASIEREGWAVKRFTLIEK